MTDRGDFDDLDDFFGRTSRPATLVVDRPPTRTAPAPRHRLAPAPTGPPARRSAPAPKPAPSVRRPRPRPIDADVVAVRTRRRLLGFVVVICLVVAGIGARLTDLQVTSRQRWVTYGAKQRLGVRTLEAGRGAILDRNGNPFAMSIAESNVVADPARLAGPIRTARKLAPLLNVSVASLTTKLASSATPRQSKHYRVLATVSAPVAKEIGALKLPGIGFEARYVRQNPSGSLALPVLGKTFPEGRRTDPKGDPRADPGSHTALRGIERAYEKQLEGTPGTLTYEKDPNGNTIAGEPTKTQPAKPGTNVYLTLDQSLQYATEQALTRQVQATGAKQAMAIIARPSTGEILAMASVADDGTGTVVNTNDDQPVSAVFEPGSVNKMITVAGALQEGLVDPTTPRQVPDQLQVADHLFTDHDPHPTENWSTTDILANSSNIGTIMIAKELGASKVDQYLRAFGFGKSSGLPDEVNGIMLPLDKWSETSIGAIPIGQGIGVTAMQMLSAYNVIANDGIYVAPKLVAATDAGSGKTATAASARRRVVSADTAAATRQMLAKVVTDGTGKQAQVPGYVPFGKTGTARIPQFAGNSKDAYKDANGQYHYMGNFVGAVAGADLSIIVTVQEAKTSIYGGDLAAPVFAQLAALTLRYMQVPPPGLVEASKAPVPDLSPSALDVNGEDPGSAGSTAQG